MKSRSTCLEQTHLAKLPESEDNLTNSVSQPYEVNGFYTAFTSEKLRLQGDLCSEGVLSHIILVG